MANVRLNVIFFRARDDSFSEFFFGLRPEHYNKVTEFFWGIISEKANVCVCVCVCVTRTLAQQQ